MIIRAQAPEINSNAILDVVLDLEEENSSNEETVDEIAQESLDQNLNDVRREIREIRHALNELPSSCFINSLVAGTILLATIYFTSIYSNDDCRNCY